MNISVSLVNRLVVLGILASANPAFAQLSVDPFNFPTATRGFAYGPFQLTAFSPQANWSVPNPAQLPPGLSVSGSGLVFGPISDGAAIGLYTFTVRASQQFNQTLLTADRVFSINVVAPLTLAPAFNVTSLPAAVGNVPYNVVLADYYSVTGSAPPFRFQLGAGGVPGLSVNAAGTNYAGTPLVPSFTGEVAFRVTDANGAVSNQSFLLINASSTGLSISTPSLPAWTVNRPYFSSIVSSGGTGAYTYNLANGSPPPGLAPDLKLSCPEQVDTIQFGFLRYYRGTLSLTGGTMPYTYRNFGEFLPPGLSLSSSGVLSGPLTDTGTFNYTIGARDANGLGVFRSCSMVVVTATTTIGLACPYKTAQIGNYYNSGVTVQNAVQTPGFQLLAGALPTGLTLSASGALTGTPSGSPGLFNYTVQTQTGNGTQDLACSIRTYSAPSQANASSLNGVPSTAGTFTFGLNVNDEYQNFATRSFSVTINPQPSFNSITLPAGNVSVAYATSNIASARVGGTAPFTFSVTSGILPPGISLSSSGLLSGTPSAGGIFSFSVGVTDAAGATASATVQVTIIAPNPDPLRFSTMTLENATVGINFTQLLQAAGGSPPYRFSLRSGSTAPGTSLSPDGQIRGVPATAGTYRFEVELADNAGGRVAAVFSMAVFQGNFRLGCPNTSAEFGVNYLSMANVIGGSQPYSFSLPDGRLPGGLVLDAATGTISGRPNTAGPFVFTFAVSDARQARTQTQCSITVQNGSLRIFTEGPILTKAGELSEVVLEAGGGQGALTWSLLSAATEAGVSVNTDGRLSTRASKKGSYIATVQVRDAAGVSASRSIPIVAGDSTLALACPTVTRFQLGVSASGNFGLTGGVAPYRLNLVGGALPSGLELTNSGSFIVRALEPGTFPVQLQAVDDTNTAVTTRCSFEVVGQPFLITTDSLPDGTVSTPYAAAFASSGGIGRIRYGLTSGGLPEGLEIDGNSGSISGTPQQNGSFTIGVGASDEARRRATKSVALRIIDGPRSFRITTGSPLSDGFVGRSYSTGFAAEGGKAPYLWTINGLPNGLTASGDSFSGTPALAGEFTLGTEVRDSAGAVASKSFLLRIKASGLTITTESLPDGVLGESYIPVVAADGGRPPLTWSIVSGVIPAGVSFDPASGSFGGTATTNGQFSVTLEVIDASGATTRRGYAFEVRPPAVSRLSITTASLPNGSAGVVYSTSVGAIGGREPYSWTLNGDLPAGLSMNASGTLSGIPTAVGTSTFLVTVIDSLGLRASRALSIRIATDTAPAVSIDGLPDATTVNQNQPFTVRIASPFGVAVSGRITLGFVPDTIHGADDPVVRFSNGLRTLDFTIPAGSTTVAIAGTASLATGTLAGTIRIDSVLNFAGTSMPGPTRTIVIRRAVPVITTLTLTRSASGLEIRIEGATNTRQLSEARVTFTASGNVDLTTASQLTVNVNAAIQSWFASAASQPFGGRFALTLPFTVSGDAGGITGVSVIITNSEGASAAANAN